jgi:hypothetical protein
MIDSLHAAKAPFTQRLFSTPDIAAEQTEKKR